MDALHRTNSVLHVNQDYWRPLVILAAYDGTTEQNYKASPQVERETGIQRQIVRHFVNILKSAGVLKSKDVACSNGAILSKGAYAVMDYSIISVLDVIELFGMLEDAHDSTQVLNNEATTLFREIQTIATNAVRKSLSRLSLREMVDTIKIDCEQKARIEVKHEPVTVPLIRMNGGFIGIRGVM